jgi:hypothetical protein
MQQRREQQQQQSKRVFTASEVAEFAHCPLVWWHEQFEPAAQADNEELFARLVELEHEYDTQAPALPEYQMIEQLLLRRGAFEQDRQQQREREDGSPEVEEPVELEEVEEERVPVASTGRLMRRLFWLALAGIALGLLLMVASLVVR